MSVRTITYNELGLEGLDRVVAPENGSTWVRVLHQNGRQGTVACKGRSDVARSNRKPWKQKGTGRARAGTFRSPLWRGGGVIFGPMMRSRMLRVPQGVKKAAMADAITALLKSKNVLCLATEINSQEPKTKLARAILVEAGIADKRVALLVSANDVLTQASFANLPNVELLLFDQLNIIDLANSQSVVFFEKDFDAFKNMVSRWI